MGAVIEGRRALLDIFLRFRENKVSQKRRLILRMAPWMSDPGYTVAASLEEEEAAVVRNLFRGGEVFSFNNSTILHLFEREIPSSGKGENQER